MAQFSSPLPSGPTSGDAAPSVVQAAAPVEPPQPTESSIAAAMGGGVASGTQRSTTPAPPPNAASVDVGAIESVASRLLPMAADVRDAAAGVMRQAPDPGTAPAPDAVIDVQGSAIDALGALATAFEESSAMLALSARRYHQTEDEVARALGRVGEDR